MSHYYHGTVTIECPRCGAEIERNITAEPYDPGILSGPPENCYPPEGGGVWLDDTYPTTCMLVAYTEEEQAEIIKRFDAAIAAWTP